ncbi:hypothetical protein DL767_000114 [Monosporascus sp. MG133]|nr:hypothetical protein DL767_000114 [Monosporascus sp. MG133]
MAICEQWQKSLPEPHLTVFSDGSKDEQDAAGWGYAAYRNKRKIAQDKGRLGIAEVFDAEVEGARHGLRATMRIHAAARIHVCVDNTSVISGLTGNIPISSQDAFIEFQDRMTLAAVDVKWVPGHEGIEGNEEADRLAKEGVKMPTTEPNKATYAGARRLLERMKKQDFQDWWREALSSHKRYQQLELDIATLKCPPELDLTRKILHRLLAAHSGHGDFDRYHRRMNHTDHTPCSCGRYKTPNHLVFCRRTRRLRAQWPRLSKDDYNQDLKTNWEQLVAMPKHFEQFLKLTEFYDKICRNTRSS